MLFALVLALLAAAPATVRAEYFEEVGVTAFGNVSMDIDGGALYEAGGLLTFGVPVYDETVRLDFRLEGLLGIFRDYGEGVEVGLIPGLRMYYGKWTLQPYIEGGIGPSYNSMDIHELGSGFNFMSYAGAGLRFPMQDNMNLELGYRLRHISNAGFDERNHGVTSSQIQFGISWGF